MDRLACINIPSLPMQIALRRFPPGFKVPIVLVRDDRPTSPILQMNREARKLGLHPGLRYSEALSLVSGLRAVLISVHELALARQDILETLKKWSPSIEACPFEQGSFWVSSAGLSSLYGTETQWGASIRAALAQKRYHAVVVVGLTRGGTYVLARSRRRSTMVRTLEAERRALETAPLSLFPLTFRHRRLLAQLNITTLASLLRIRPEELSRRFGPDLVRDLRKLDAWDTLPLQQDETVDEWTRSLRFDTPLTDRASFLPLLEAPLREGLDTLVRRGRLLAELRLVFVLESEGPVSEVLRPAAPTTNLTLLKRLLDLRLGRLELPTGVVEIRLALTDVPLPPATGELFAPPPPRDPKRGAESLALIRAQWGNDAVVHAVLADSHVPEKSYRWEEVSQLKPPVPLPQRSQAASVRRVPLQRHEKHANPAGQRVAGPYRLRVLSESLDKDYWFLRTTGGEVAWASWNRLDAHPHWEGVVD